MTQLEGAPENLRGNFSELPGACSFRVDHLRTDTFTIFHDFSSKLSHIFGSGKVIFLVGISPEFYLALLEIHHLEKFKTQDFSEGAIEDIILRQPQFFNRPIGLFAPPEKQVAVRRHATKIDRKIRRNNALYACLYACPCKRHLTVNDLGRTTLNHGNNGINTFRRFYQAIAIRQVSRNDFCSPIEQTGLLMRRSASQCNSRRNAARNNCICNFMAEPTCGTDNQDELRHEFPHD